MGLNFENSIRICIVSPFQVGATRVVSRTQGVALIVTPHFYKILRLRRNHYFAVGQRLTSLPSVWRNICLRSPDHAREPGLGRIATLLLGRDASSSFGRHGGAGMATMVLETSGWAVEQFSNCKLGDQRRSKRLVKLATQCAAKPDAATPEQTENWSDCKAAYRLFEQTDVTFDAVIAPHCAQTRDVEPGTWLVLNDTTEINFGRLRDIEGIGRVGSNQGRGFYLHTALLVADGRDELVGIAGQDLYKRPLKKVPRVASNQRKARARETDVWGRVIDQVGPAPEGARFIHVCDRGADNFEVYCHFLEQGNGWVVRAAQLERKVYDEQNRLVPLKTVFDEQPCLGTYELQVRAQKNQPARTARIEVRSAQIVLPRPMTGVSLYVKRCGIQEIPMGVVEVREVDPPKGVKALQWVLMTSEAVHTFDDAWQTIERYERRPLIEEYHKCIKTGCRVEERQYQHADRLAPVIGLLSVLGVRLLQLKMLARDEPERPADEVVPKRWLKALPLVSKNHAPIRTVREFIRRLAGLGGFLGRKGDGEPGWQTIWRGLQTLLLCLRGAHALRKKCG
jgi:hypothetical protein